MEKRGRTPIISVHTVLAYFSKHPWQPGDEVMVTPVNDETTCGNVVYCQRLPDDRYGIGVKFRDRLVTWSAMRRYDGIQISSLAKSKPS